MRLNSLYEIVSYMNEPVSRKRYKLACAPIEDSDQTAVAKGSTFLQAENLNSDQTVWISRLI